MSEREIESERPSIELIRACKFIGRKAVNEVTKSYGRGLDMQAIRGGDFSSALEPATLYPFHSLVHSMNVGQTARIIAEGMNLSPRLVALAEAAGHTHDVIRRGTIGEDEGESAEWFEKYARLYRLSDEDTEIGSLAIYGTIPILDNFMLVDQHVSLMKEEGVFERELSPEKAEEAELIARIVASADLGELFQPTGPLMSHMLLFEINKGKPSYEQLLNFQRTQVAMLDRYKHPLGELTPDILLQDKQAVIEHSKQLLKDLEERRITSWEAIVTRSCEFVLAA